MPAAYAVYLRKSRADAEAEARGEGETLARHRKTLLSLAASRGYTVGKLYEEVVSGDTVAARPAMQALLADVEAGLWAGVLVMEIERLARGDTIDQGIVAQTFKCSGAAIITPAKTYDPNSDIDEEYFEFGLFMARREYKTIKRRLQAGRVASVRDGLYCGSVAPYGYARYKLPDRKGWSLRVNPAQAEIVRMIYGWYVGGLDGREAGGTVIANRLNDMGVRTDRNLPWTADRVIALLKNPVYAGRVQWNRRVQAVRMADGQRVKSRVRSANPVIVQGLHEPIVGAETWESARRLMENRRKSPIPSARTTANLFAGLAKCAVCGRAMIRQANSAGKARYDILKCSGPRCPNRGVYITAVEDAVLEALRFGRRAYQTRATPVSSAETEAPRKHCEAALVTLRAQLAALHDLLEQGVYTPDVFAARQRALTARIAEAQAALEACGRPAPSTCAERIRALQPPLTTVLEAYAVARSIPEKNALLKSVLSSVVCAKPRRRRKGQPPAAFLTLDIFPSVPE